MNFINQANSLKPRVVLCMFRYIRETTLHSTYKKKAFINNFLNYLDKVENRFDEFVSDYKKRCYVLINMHKSGHSNKMLESYYHMFFLPLYEQDLANLHYALSLLTVRHYYEWKHANGLMGNLIDNFEYWSPEGVLKAYEDELYRKHDHLQVNIETLLSLNTK